ncbi:MAG: hypothetical protein ACREV1_00900 [Gammaproteobacteria bacterium]
MLNLMEPVELEDLVVCRDDEDPRTFYLLPDQPVIPLNDEGEPEFLFIKYLKDVDSTAEGQDSGGALVQFRSVLTIKTERRQRVIEALRTRLEQEKAAGKRPFGRTIDVTEPLLAAPLWTDGRVTLATFKVSDSGLVRHVTDSVPVDLAGDLGASLSLELDPDGAEIFWSAFENWQEGQIPIVITYQLSYKARVSASMTIHAKREVIHRQILQYVSPYRLLTTPFLHYQPIAITGAFSFAMLAGLRSTWGASVTPMVTCGQIHEAVRQTIVNNEITVHIETDTESGAQVQEALFKIATEVLSEQVIPALFSTGSGKPGVSQGAGAERQEVFEVSEGDPGGGSASFDLKLDHLSTITRSVNPNGPIGLLLEKPETLQRCFKTLRLSDGFFNLMKVSASTVNVNFERDGIDSIHVFFRYNQQDEQHPDKPWVTRAKDAFLRSEKDVLYWRFDTARAAEGSHKRSYEYRTEVFYRQGPPSKTEWVRSSDRELAITPRAMGALRVELALTAPKERVGSARVALQYVSSNGVRYATALELTPEANTRSWFQYTGELAVRDADLNPMSYSYQVTYRVEGGEIVMPWAQSSDEILEIPSPFRKLLVFHIRSRGSFEGVGSISGDITYEHREYSYRVSKSFDLTTLQAGTDFTVPVLAGGPETAAFSARINRKDGSSVELAPGEAQPGTVFIGTDFQIQVLADLIDFDRDVQLAVVELSYLDPENGTSQRQTFTFSKTARGAQVWAVDVRDPRSATYAADIRYVAYDRAKNSELHLRQLSDQVLVLDRAPA